MATDPLAKLRDDRSAHRARALRDLISLDDDELDAIDDLEVAIASRLEDEAPEVVQAALEAIGALTHRGLAEFSGPTLSAVLALRRSTEPSVRAEVAVAASLLTAPADEASLRAIRELLEDSDPRVQREAAAAVGDLRDESSIPKLARLLESDDPETGFEAAYALAHLGNDRGLDLLVRGLGSEQHRMASCEALRHLGDPRALVPLERLARGIFIGWPDRLTAAATLYTLGDHDAGDRVVRRTRAWSTRERAYALSLVGSHGIEAGFTRVREVVADARDATRGFAIQALGEIGDGRDVDVLTEIAEAEGATLEIRKEAIRALAKLGEAGRARLESQTARLPQPLAHEAKRALRLAART